MPSQRTPTGELFQYVSCSVDEPGGEIHCTLSATAAEAVRNANGAPINFVEANQARRLSHEREAAAFNRAIKSADCCVKCTMKIQEHYDSMVDARADDE